MRRLPRLGSLPGAALRRGGRYHLRRIWFSVVNFPASLSFDAYLNHPLGAPSVWPPLFDWSIAAVARALVGPADQAAVEVVAAWAPPVLGAAAVLAAAWLARRSFSPAAGWVTGALLAVQPAHVFYSGLGEVDHHVAVGHPSAAGYAVRARSRSDRLVLTEADVREGRTVAGPSFEP